MKPWLRQLSYRLQRPFDKHPVMLIALATLGVPIVVARRVVGASAEQIALAYILWFGGIAVILGGFRVRRSQFAEVFGFTLIFGMFSLWAGVPIVASLLRLLDLP